jgi:hypothetical protein
LTFNREWYKVIGNLVAKSPFWTSEKPAKNSEQLLCGFFLKPPRRSYQDLPKAGEKWDWSAELKGLISQRDTNQY